MRNHLNSMGAFQMINHLPTSDIYAHGYVQNCEQAVTIENPHSGKPPQFIRLCCNGHSPHKICLVVTSKSPLQLLNLFQGEMYVYHTQVLISIHIYSFRNEDENNSCKNHLALKEQNSFPPFFL